MNTDPARLERVLRRYRVMFRMAIALIASGVVAAAAGLVYAFTDESTTMLGGGILFLVLAVFLAYRIVLSTMRILDHARDEGVDLSD